MLEVHPALANTIIAAFPEAYQLLVVRGAAPARAHELLDGVTAKQMGQGSAAEAMLGGLWLWHDALEECHRIVQKDEEAGAMRSTFAYWHAIMHRREGDFSNSKYWLARSGKHPAFARIAADLPAVIEKSAAVAAQLAMDGWNPAAMVDLVEKVHGHPDDPLHSTAVAVQRLEWKSLFAYCDQQAAGPAPE